jgi:hypothetical protein
MRLSFAEKQGKEIGRVRETRKRKRELREMSNEVPLKEKILGAHLTGE